MCTVGGHGSRFAFGIFFSFVGDQTWTPTRPKLMSSPDDVIINQLQAISQLFSSYPPSGEFCQVSELTIQTKKMGPGRGEMFIWSKLGQIPSDRTFARMKNVIWDRLLAT